MSSAIFKAANTNNLHSSLRAALFHSTPPLQRKRRNYWDSRGHNHYSRRFRRMQAKQRVMNSINDYAEFLFQSWKEDIGKDDPSSSRGTSWFRKQYSDRESERYRNGNQGSRSHRYRRDPLFCEDDYDVETIFRSAFGGNRFFYWSFINEENPQWRRSESFSNFGKSWNWRYRSENNYDSSSESDSSDSDFVPDRLALGLSASGPLKLEDVKNAYRACALKWHPDRHQGSSKAIAEEKFKLCSAAYQSLCDKLALD
ncbi:DnaJ-like subfamily B member 8 [Spatholobus suberectus]|nr:DnaJ-like subfamily B member 8 [Spatholobus suberectus]